MCDLDQKIENINLKDKNRLELKTFLKLIYLFSFLF